MRKFLLTRKRLIQLFEYDSVTGVFTHKTTRGPANAGGVAGSPTGHGYRKITIDYEKHYEHHLAWLYIHGEYPEMLDHADGNRSNNAISNLRVATRTQNRYNHKRSELTGAYFSKRTGKWFSQIQMGPNTRWLGTFNSAEAAANAYRTASIAAHGEFAVSNRLTRTQESC